MRAEIQQPDACKAKGIQVAVEIQVVYLIMSEQCQCHFSSAAFILGPDDTSDYSKNTKAAREHHQEIAWPLISPDHHCLLQQGQKMYGLLLNQMRLHLSFGTKQAVTPPAISEDQPIIKHNLLCAACLTNCPHCQGAPAAERSSSTPVLVLVAATSAIHM
jgi:hypothetical protein